MPKQIQPPIEPQSHPNVAHPNELLIADTKIKIIETWITDKLTSVLGSFLVFAFCFTVPLLAIPASTAVKLVVGIVLSNWFQAWALPVLQRSQTKTQAQNDAQAEATYRTDTYIATLQDQQMDELKLQTGILDELKSIKKGQ